MDSTEKTGDRSTREVSRRRVLGAVGAATVTATAGCLDGINYTYTQTGSKDRIEITEFSTFDTIFGSGSSVTVKTDVSPVRAIVWLGSEGHQLGAREVEYGNSEITVEIGDSTDDLIGDNSLVAVSGGNIDCFLGEYGDRCSLSGGTPQAETTFEVIP